MQILPNLTNLSLLPPSSFSPVKGYIRKGTALLGMKDTVKALHAYERALELDPNNSVSPPASGIPAIASSTPAPFITRTC